MLTAPDPLPGPSDAPTTCVDNTGTPAQRNESTGDQVTAMGTFHNEAWLLINAPCRPNPHFLSQHTYYLSGELGDENLSPDDMMVSHGTENASFPDQGFRRAVLGGTGQYRFARGEVIQERMGRNSTRIRGLGAPGQEPFSPNYRFTFTLMMA